MTYVCLNLGQTAEDSDMFTHIWLSSRWLPSMDLMDMPHQNYITIGLYGLRYCSVVALFNSDLLPPCEVTRRVRSDINTLEGQELCKRSRKLQKND